MTSPDPWQKDALTQIITKKQDVLMLVTRGGGKSEAFAAASYLEASLGGFAMILSRSDRQALRIMRRVAQYSMFTRLQPVARQTMHEIQFANGGRVIALPGSSDTIVGEHGVTLLGIDEAARVKDEFFAYVDPMLIVSERTTGIKPRKALLSTPFGKRGFFYRAWCDESKNGLDWQRHRYTWQQCPRIRPEDIAKYAHDHGEEKARQEFECEFTSAESSCFNLDLFEEAVDDDVQLMRAW